MSDEDSQDSNPVQNTDMQKLAKQQIMQQMMDDLDQEDLLKLAVVSNDDDTDMAAMLAMLND